MSSYSMQTDPGARYDVNEDTVGCDEACDVWVVADGMGGHAAGEVASEIAKDTFLAQTRDGVDSVTSVLHAHGAIAASAEAQEAQQGMGSTLVAMRIVERQAHLVWVGDSRCYLWREGTISVVTHDHSYVQLLIDQGHLTDETARDHPKRNMVTQVLGLGDPAPETSVVGLQNGDWLVLCSDGLNDELTDAEIAQELVAAGGEVEKAADLLIQRALQHGGRDNVSVVAVEYSGETFDGPLTVAFSKDEPAADDSSVEGSSSETPVADDSSPAWLAWLKSPLILGMIAAVIVFIVFVFLTRGG